MDGRSLTIRAATPEDSRDLQRLAELDSAPRLRGRALLAEAEGVPIAAVSLASGAVIADPFTRTPDAVRMLRLRRFQLTRPGGRRERRSLFWRVARGTA